MSTVGTGRERELQSLLKQKESELKQANAELEERGKLLYKTKVAIEQLQQELTASRREEQAIREEATRVCEDQAAQLRTAEDQLHHLEEQLSQALAKAKEFQGKASTFEAELDQSRHQGTLDSSTSQQKLRDKDRRIAVLEEELQSAKDQQGTLNEMMKDLRTKLSTMELDREESDRLIRELTAKNKQLLQDKTSLEQQVEAAKDLHDSAKREAARAAQNVELGEKEKVAIIDDWSRKLDALKRENEDNMREAERRLRDLESVWQNKQETNERSWVGRLQEVEQHWEKRLRDGMSACERKFTEEAAEWERRLRDNDAAWQAKVAELEALWRTRLSDEQRMYDSDRAHLEAQVISQRAELETHWQAKLEELRRSLELALEEAQAKAASERLALERSWQQRVDDLEASAARRAEEARAKWANERAAAEEGWAGKAGELEAKLRRKIDELKRKAAARELEIDTQWQEKVNELVRRQTQEQEAMTNAWHARLTAAQEEAATRYRALQDELDSKVANISGRLSDMAGKETRREVQRTELTRQLEELQASYDTEFRRRSELERALREAAALFKQELYEKQAELDAAYRDARSMRHQLALQQVIVSSPRLRQLDDGYQVTTVGGGGAVSQIMYGSPPGSAPAAHDLTAPAGPASTAMDLEAELQTLRQARAEYQRSITASQDARSGLLGAMDRTDARLDPYGGRRGFSTDNSPALNRNAARSPHDATRSPVRSSPSAAQYINRLLGDDGRDARLRDTTARGHPPPLGDSGSFDAWKDKLSARLSSALRKLEPTLGGGR